MPAYNFQSQFVPAILRREKRQTIRARRKHPPRVGQTAYLFTSMRTKKCRRLGESRIRRVADITIHSDGFYWNGAWLFKLDDLHSFARRDGFSNWPEMLAFFRKRGLPFHGDLIEWE